MKIYNIQYNVGRAKYAVSYHDGVSTYADGSKFYDIAIFKNKRDLNKFINELINAGYENI